MKPHRVFQILAVAAATLGLVACDEDKQAGGANAATESMAGSLAGYDAILKKYVRGENFAYAELKANAEDLKRFEDFLRWQGEAKIDDMTRDDQIAFYINAYNSGCIKGILDHYPVHSPMDIDGYFDKLKYKVAGEMLTVSEIEYDRLIANYKDMRAHFAVVCSDRGCLPLKAGAYTGADLERDLETAARKFAGDERHFKIDPEKNEVHISKIFEWYGEKFTQDPTRPAAKPELFLLPWVSAEARTLLESDGYKLRIIEWNWTLNEKLTK